MRASDPLTLLNDATTFVIDAIDELSVQNEGDAVDAVLKALEKAKFPNFVIACRVADWRSATSTQAVVDSYGANPLELFLEPILRDEALALLSQDIGRPRAGRWLSQQADTERKRRRLLRLFHGHGLVPTNLRGVHAWLAGDPRFTPSVIEADPMGVVEYGDTDELSVDQTRTLLKALHELSNRDPRNHDVDTPTFPRVLSI